MKYLIIINLLLLPVLLLSQVHFTQRVDIPNDKNYEVKRDNVIPSIGLTFEYNDEFTITRFSFMLQRESGRWGILASFQGGINVLHWVSETVSLNILPFQGYYKQHTPKNYLQFFSSPSVTVGIRMFERLKFELGYEYDIIRSNHDDYTKGHYDIFIFKCFIEL